MSESRFCIGIWFVFVFKSSAKVLEFFGLCLSPKTFENFDEINQSLFLIQKLVFSIGKLIKIMIVLFHWNEKKKNIFKIGLKSSIISKVDHQMPKNWKEKFWYDLFVKAVHKLIWNLKLHQWSRSDARPSLFGMW